MVAEDKVRYIGIFGDGATDREILLEIVRCVLEESSANNLSLEPVMLPQQKIRDYVDKYWNKSKHCDGCGFPGDPARELTNGVIQALYGAFIDFQAEADRPLGMQDMLLFSTDAERYLTQSERYFDDWAWILSKILLGAVEKFYHLKLREIYYPEYLPMISPLVLFPSTEIIVTAARTASGVEFNGYNKNARQLKREIYGTDNLRSLPDGKFKREALNYITSEGIKFIYQYVPESRLFLQMLSWAK